MISAIGNFAISSRTHHGPIRLPRCPCPISPPLSRALPIRCAAQVPRICALEEERGVEGEAGPVGVYLW